MEEMFFYFLENMALIIALLYLELKLKEFILPRVKTPAILMGLIALFIGFMTISIMLHPLEHKGMRIDLREVPLFFISYLGGLRLGVLSAILPGFFRIYLGGPTTLDGLLQTIVLPVLMGALFHRKGSFVPPYAIVDIKKLLAGFALFQVVKSMLMYVMTPATVVIILMMVLFSFIAMIGIGLMLNDFNQKEISRKELEYLSYYDPMTSLPNIRYFKKEAGLLIREKLPVAIMMVDVDYFKHYNDTHGHQAGDEVLRGIGRVLTASTGRNDFAARYGGEEFIVCFGDMSNREEVQSAAMMLRYNIRKYRFKGIETQPGGRLTVSMGISFADKEKPLEQLIEEADQALYWAKQNGRDQIHVYVEPELQNVQKRGVL